MNQPETGNVLNPEPGFLQETINGIKHKIYLFGDGLRSLNPFNKTNEIDCTECNTKCNQSNVTSQTVGGKKIRKRTKKHFKKHAKKTRSYKK